MLSVTWVIVVLIYLHGDVLRICSGDLAKNSMADKHLNQYVWLGIAPAYESLGKYHRGCFLFPVQPGWPAHLPIVI